MRCAAMFSFNIEVHALDVAMFSWHVAVLSCCVARHEKSSVKLPSSHFVLLQFVSLILRRWFFQGKLFFASLVDSTEISSNESHSANNTVAIWQQLSFPTFHPHFTVNHIYLWLKLQENCSVAHRIIATQAGSL